MRTLKYIAMAAMAGFLSLPIINNAEAATVALLPLVNNVAEKENLESVYYDRAVEVVKMDPSYELVDSSALDKAIEKNVKPQMLTDRQACEAIAQEANIDVVIAMQVDEMTVKELGTQEDTVILGLRGKCVSYNALTGKYIAKNIVEEDKVEGSVLARFDMPSNQFANSVTREMKRALGIKKITFEKPRISKAGFKGDRK